MHFESPEGYTQHSQQVRESSVRSASRGAATAAKTRNQERPPLRVQRTHGAKFQAPISAANSSLGISWIFPKTDSYNQVMFDGLVPAKMATDTGYPQEENRLQDTLPQVCCDCWREGADSFCGQPFWLSEF